MTKFVDFIFDKLQTSNYHEIETEWDQLTRKIPVDFYILSAKKLLEPGGKWENQMI